MQTWTVWKCLSNNDPLTGCTCELVQAEIAATLIVQLTETSGGMISAEGRGSVRYYDVKHNVPRVSTS